MIPLRDDVPASRTPVVTWAIVAACIAVFVLQTGDPQGEIVERFAMVPARVVHGDVLPRAGELLPPWATLFTCMFLHGGWLHVLGNMLFLWIFGDNVEDRFGRLPFLVFYLVCGLAAAGLHLLSAPDSRVPTIGASGAISGVMGAYLVLYPHARVQMLLVFGFFVDFLVLPAPYFLGYWFLLQLLGATLEHGQGGGIAWWAHVGGFAAGLVVAAVLRVLGWLRPGPARVVLRSGRVGTRR